MTRQISLWQVAAIVVAACMLLMFGGCSLLGGGEPEPQTELERLPDTAVDEARDAAAACDAGGAQSCCALAQMWAEGERYGLIRSMGQQQRIMDRVGEEMHRSCMDM